MAALATGLAAPLTAAMAQDAAPPGSSFVDLGNTEIYSHSLAALTMLLVLAVLLENALSLLFNWRVFLAYFSLKGVKTIIMVAVAMIIVMTFPVDIVATLISAYVEPDVASNLLTQFLTALILAGGSSGVYNIMRALGYRSDERTAEIVVRPPKTEAWLAIKVKRVRAVGDILVTIKEEAKAVPELAPIAGVVGGGRPELAELLFPSPNRFPRSGGYTLKPNQVYEISVIAADAAGGPLVGPAHRVMSFAPGAVVDLSVTL